MPDDVDRVVEQIAQSRKWRETGARIAATLAPSTGRAAVGGFAPGDRVFDTVSGEEGVVIDGTRENVVVPTAK